MRWKRHRFVGDVEGASPQGQAIRQLIVFCAWLVGRWALQVLPVVMVTVLATLITIRMSCWGWLFIYLFIFSKMLIESHRGRPSQTHDPLPPSALHCCHMISLYEYPGRSWRALLGGKRWCHSRVESSSSLWHHWIVSKMKAAKGPFREYRASTRSLQSWHFRAGCPLCWSCWIWVN